VRGIHNASVKIDDMNTRTAIFVVILVLLTSACFGDVFDEALSAAGLTKETAVFDELDLAIYGGDKFRLPYFDTYHRAPYRVPEQVKLLVSQASRASGRVFDLVGMTSTGINEGVRRSLIGSPAEPFIKKAEQPNSLAKAVLEVWQIAGKKPPRGFEKRLNAQASSVPSDVSKMAAALIFSEISAAKWRNLAFKRLFDKYDAQQLYSHILSAEESDFDFIREDMMNLTDLKLVMTGGEDLAAVIDKVVVEYPKLSVTKAFHFEANTPLGAIVIDCSGDSVYRHGRDFMLILDLTGNDVYYSGAACSSASNSVSVLIDFAGSDCYLESPQLDSLPVGRLAERKTWRSSPNTCGALMGYAFLVDVSGNDRYSGVSRCLGYAAYGCAVLIDFAGDDIYRCYQMGQGSAEFGVGVLCDCAGSDNYNCFTTSQGFGGIKGYGLLLDASGDDIYTANRIQIDFPSAQDSRHNGSLSQGMGCGERGDYTTGHSYAGGIGALIDLAGNDQYTADIMAQGMGYWYGLGVLADVSGDDTYMGYWYNQGSAAHFAVGVLYDGGGSDYYSAPCNMVQGAGHDYSLGMLIDENGDDSYTAAGISLGGGNANGIGIFWDKSGSDTYQVTGNPTLGRANIGSRGSIRDRDICMGLFLDTGGTDYYPVSYPFAQNNTIWLQKGMDEKNPLPTEIGIGLDKQQ